MQYDAGLKFDPFQGLEKLSCRFIRPAVEIVMSEEKGTFRDKFRELFDQLRPPIDSKTKKDSKAKMNPKTTFNIWYFVAAFIAFSLI